MSATQFGRGDFDNGQVSYHMRQTEPHLPQRISSNIQTVQQSVRQIQTLNSKIGTAQDSQQSRERLHEVQQQTNQLVKETGSLLKELSHTTPCPNSQRAARMQRIRLAEDFTAVLNQFQTAQRRTAQAEKDSVQRARANSEHFGGVSSLYEVREEHGFSQTRQIMAMEQDVDLGVIQGREAAIKALDGNIRDVNQLFKDLGLLVHDQGETIDSIVDNIDIARVHVQDGTYIVDTARNYQKKSRKKICILLLILSVVLAVFIVGIIAWKAS